MALGNNPRTQPRPSRFRLLDPGIPHRSWRTTSTCSAHNAQPVVDASDFWARLGI